ncbi:MAG: hypothetical protein IKX22_09905 [Prevotella sp.]|nr:hypothetical protein [Prevotella sp.]
MAFKRFQNIFAESRFSLPFLMVVTVATWMFRGLLEDRLWMQFICLGMSTYLMIELNNANQLLRVYSKMVSGSFLLLLIAANPLFPSLRMSIIALCSVALYTMLFRCYQQKKSSGWVFYGFLCYGLASLVFPQIVFFIPFLWGSMAFNLYALNAKTFFSSLLGLLTPYWFLFGYSVFSGNLSFWPEHVSQLSQFAPLFDYSGVSEHQLVTFGFVAICALIGIIHYMRNSFSDKIQTRMLFEVFILMDVMSLLFLVLQPQHYEPLMGMLIVNTAPLLAHFITLTRTWLTNIAFYLILLLSFTIAAYHLWMPSLIF